MFDRKREKFGNLPEDLQKLKDIREYKRNKAVPNDRWQEILASVECPEVDRIYMHTYDRDSNLWVGTSGGLWLSPVKYLCSIISTEKAKWLLFSAMTNIVYG